MGIERCPCIAAMDVDFGVFRNALDLKLKAHDDLTKQMTTTSATKRAIFDLMSIFRGIRCSKRRINFNDPWIEVTWESVVASSD